MADKKKEKSPEVVAFAKQFLSGIGVNVDELKEADQREDQKAERELKSEAIRQSREKHYWIQVIRMPEDNETHAFVGAAGVPYQLEKGVRMPVPQSVLNALEMAKVEGYVPVVDEMTQQKKQVLVKYDRYPLQVFGECSPEEAKAWKLEQQRKARARAGIVEAPAAAAEVWGAPKIEYSNPERVLSD